MNTPLHNFVTLGWELLRQGVMVAIRDPANNQYLYNNMGHTWSGFSLEEWNAMGSCERLIHFNMRDAEKTMDAYAKWRENTESDTIQLSYRVSGRAGKVKHVQCRFIKVFQDGHLYIIEVSRICTADSENNSLEDSEKHHELQIPIPALGET